MQESDSIYALVKIQKMIHSVKYFLILLGLVASFPKTQAQSLSVGIRGGTNFSKIYFKDLSEDLADIRSRPGLDFGLLFNVGISEPFSIQPEIHYMQKGFRNKAESLGREIQQNNIINYLEIPVLAKYTFGNERIKLLINTGPSVGCALNGKETIEGFFEEKEEVSI